MFLMSNSTKICNVFNKYKSKIVQLNFKIKVVSLPGNKDKFPPESLIICREILNPIPLPPSLPTLFPDIDCHLVCDVPNHVDLSAQKTQELL